MPAAFPEVSEIQFKKTGQKSGKERKMKKAISLVLIVAMLVTLSCSMAFAATVNQTGGKDIQVLLTTEAEGVDFTINDSITLAAEAGSTELEISPLEISNNKLIGQLVVESLELTGNNTWTVVSDETEFKNLPADTKQFSMVCNGHDFAEDAKLELGQQADYIAPAADEDTPTTKTYTFTGHIGSFTTAITEPANVATMVATISVLKAQ